MSTEDERKEMEETPEEETEAPEAEAPAEPETEAEEPEQPSEEEAPTPAAPKKGSRLLDALIVVVLLGAALAGTYYWPEISAFFRLRAWSKSGPRQTLQQFATALKNNDEQSLRALLPEENFEIIIEDGKITKIKQQSMMGAPPVDVKAVTPTETDNAPVKFLFDPTKWGAKITVRAANGEYCEFKLRTKKGQWYIDSLTAGIASPPAP